MVTDTGALNYSGTCGDRVIFFRKYLEDLVMDMKRDESTGNWY